MKIFTSKLNVHRLSLILDRRTDEPSLFKDLEYYGTSESDSRTMTIGMAQMSKRSGKQRSGANEGR